MNVDDNLRKVIDDVIREHLGSRHILDVLVRRDPLEDDDILLVTIVTDDEEDDIDNAKVLTLVGQIQPRLAANQETAFPVIYFMTAKEREAAV